MNPQGPSSTPPAKELPVRVVQFSLVRPSTGEESLSDSVELPLNAAPVQLYLVLFPESAFPLAKSYWQHTGDGVSSRLAEHCLDILKETGRLGDETPASGSQTPAAASRSQSTTRSTATGDDTGDLSTSTSKRYSKNRHYSRANSANGIHVPTPPNPLSALPALRAVQDEADPDVEFTAGDTSAYVEERYGRNLPASSAPMAKRVLKRRIAGTLLADRVPPPHPDAQGKQSSEHEVGTTAREGTSLSEDDVWLYPTGMSSIFHAHQTALRWRKATTGSSSQVGKSVCFGFPYIDTLKILQKWGPGCHFYGNGLDSDLDDLEELLENQATSGEAPVLCLFCEFPSNPLLRCPDLPRIRKLADKYNFVVTVDETIGNFLNVEVLPYADLVVSSLTKVFSGDANVMGGSMVLNPQGPQADALREALREEYEDNYWGIDAVFMERNSRDFATRVEKIDQNAEVLAAFMYDEMNKEKDSTGTQLIKGVYYPKYVTKNHYDACRRSKNLLGDSSRRSEGGYGGLFSVIFTSMTASSAFHDALKCAKGPSLGTNFTLVSPYTILAHYTELDWASQFGVEKTLVRVSTGLEETEELLRMFSTALQAAREAVDA